MRVWLRLHLKMDGLHHEWRSRARNAYWNDNNGNVNSNVNNSNNQNDNLGSRGVIRVYWLCEDFSHPPSILPISCTSAWSWKTRVSFMSLSSSRRRSFKVKTSNVPLALSRYGVFKVFGVFLAITSCSIKQRMPSSTLFPKVSLHFFVMWS